MIPYANVFESAIDMLLLTIFVVMLSVFIYAIFLIFAEHP